MSAERYACQLFWVQYLNGPRCSTKISSINDH